MAELGGFIRTFFDEGAPMAQFVDETAKRRIMPDFTSKLLTVFETFESLFLALDMVKELNRRIYGKLFATG